MLCYGCGMVRYRGAECDVHASIGVHSLDAAHRGHGVPQMVYGRDRRRHLEPRALVAMVVRRTVARRLAPYPRDVGGLRGFHRLRSVTGRRTASTAVCGCLAVHALTRLRLLLRLPRCHGANLQISSYNRVEGWGLGKELGTG